MALAAPAWLSSARASAQSLQRLSVESFTLASDAERPVVGAPFHLIVTLRVRQRVGSIDNLELPVLAQLELLGDERALQSSRDGTTYRETIALVAHQPGDVAVSPAVLQAVDARDGKPKAFSTNPLTLHVVESPSDVLARQARTAKSIAWFLLHVAIWVVGVVCVGALLVLLFRRRPAPVAIAAPPPVAAPLPPIVPLTKHDRFRDALTVLRAERTRAAAVRVRAAVWNALGAGEGETLGDVLRRPDTRDPATAGVLRALERAAFTYDADLPAAIADACDALQRYLDA